jgi:hypothetical protein
MRRFAAGLGVTLWLTTTAVDARAAPNIEVSSTDQTPGCPDTAELLRLAFEVQGSVVPLVTHAYRVSFDRTAQGYRAEIVDETAQRTRHLTDVGAACAPLGRAVAVTLVVMWGTEELQQPPGPPPAPEPAPRPAPPAPTSYWLVGVGGAAAVGIVPNAAPALTVDSSFENGHLSWALGALWIPMQSLPLAPGSIDVQLLAGAARGCAFALDRTHVGLCARVSGGELAAKSNGYDTNGQKTRPWFALGLETFVDGPLASRRLRYRLAAAALVPVHVEVFSIQNLGPTRGPSPIGALFTLALELETSR